MKETLKTMWKNKYINLGLPLACSLDTDRIFVLSVYIFIRVFSFYKENNIVQIALESFYFSGST